MRTRPAAEREILSFERTCAVCKRSPAAGIELLFNQCLRREARKRSQELRAARQREQGEIW